MILRCGLARCGERNAVATISRRYANAPSSSAQIFCYFAGKIDRLSPKLPSVRKMF